MKIVVYPRADKNPYQQLLYTALEKNHDVRIDYLKNTRSSLIFFPLILLIKRLQGYKVFHLHWPHFYVAKTNPKAALISFLLSRYCLYAIRLSGLRLVWTVHNATPHEAETINDLNIAKYIAKHASAKIVHSSFALKELKKLGLDTSSISVIPHGNYTGVYDDILSRDQARRQLHIASNEFVILFFGLIRAYKGIDDLLEAYSKVQTPTTRLLIVGESQDAALTRQITEASHSMSASFYPGFVDDAEVAMYFKASDVVCLPFKTITTSGSALLALTFGKPIIAPRAGSLVDLPEDVGYFYNPSDRNGLYNCVQDAIQDRRGQDKRTRAARSFVQTLNWDNIATQTYKLYSSVQETN